MCLGVRRVCRLIVKVSSGAAAVGCDLIQRRLPLWLLPGVGALRLRTLPGGIFVIQKPCPVGQQHQPPLQRGTPLQKNIQFVPTLCCKRGQTDAGVAAGLLHDGTAGFQQSGFFRSIEYLFYSIL